MKGLLFGLFLTIVFPVLVVAGNVNNADPSDIVQATQFLSSLPSACGKSYMDVSEDGTVNIHIICISSNCLKFN